MTSSSVSSALATEIRQLHAGIMRSLRKTVGDAIRAGELLSQAKESLPHGQFLSWIREETGLEERTARRYMGIYRHRTKTVSVSDLTEAYRIVAEIETDDRQQSRRADPPGGTEAQEAVVDAETEAPARGKRAKLTPERQAEVDEFSARMKREDAEAQERYEQNKPASQAEVDEILRHADEHLRELREAAERFSHLTLAGGADNQMQTSMLGLLRRYVMSFDTPARRSEVSHNLIKALRLIIHEVNESDEGDGA